jgi:hypothetical protein
MSSEILNRKVKERITASKPSTLEFEMSFVEEESKGTCCEADEELLVVAQWPCAETLMEDAASAVSDSISDECTGTPYLRASPAYLPRQRNSSFSSSIHSGISSGPATNSRVDTWLDGIFVSTLSSQVRNSIFIGGAGDTFSEGDKCPLCGGEVGDIRDQHLLRCKFAHEERDREEELLHSRCQDL